MSSPTRATDGSNDDDDFIDKTTEKSFGFRRWSRNLSAQRHRELNRLNQIERRRQFLELKTQNDLFNQMSVTVNGPCVDEKNHLKVENSTGPITAATTTTTTCSGQNKHSTIALNELSDSINQPERGHAGKTTKNERNKQPTHVPNNQRAPIERSNKLDFSANELRLTSLSSPEDDLRIDEGKDTNLDEIVRVSIKAQGQLQTLDEQRQIKKLASGVQGKDDTGHCVKRPITSEQLTRFVSSRVPENKRVLCLIVRDKMSRLNKAKSYFYPTYYLFIQAIVDIDETATRDQGSNQVTIKSTEDNMPGVVDNENLTVEAPTSTDNSFSASSSISADMLFIGANGNAANLSSMKVLSGNSYSDNEVYADTETEEDNPASGKTAMLAKQVRVKSGLLIKSAGNLQGRDSPLVFPNRDNNNNCNSSESGSLIDAWSAIRQDAGKILSDACTSTNAATNLRQSSNLKKGPITSRRTTRANGSSKSGPIESQVDPARLIDKRAAIQSAGEISNDDSNEDGDDMDDDDDDDSDHDESNRWVHVVNSSRNCNSEEVNRNNVTTSAATAHATTTSNQYDHENKQQSFFDNERNPYTGTYGVLLAGRRRKKAKTYLIGLNEYGYTRKNSICKLKSNVLGTQFNAIRLNHADNNDRCNIASISYETNVLGFKGPRKMRAFLPKDPGKGSKNLTETFKKNPAAVVQLKNMTPSWNVESQSYVLNFHGRVTQASVKNFQLIESEIDYFGDGPKGAIQRDASGSSANNYDQPQQQQVHQKDEDGCFETASNLSLAQRLLIKKHRDPINWQGNEQAGAIVVNAATLPTSIGNTTQLLDKNPSTSCSKSHTQYNSSIVMQFGRISNHEFTCDVTYPLSILQAFAIALSSFDSKLACE